MEQSNREAFLKAKKILSQNKDLEFFDGEIYALLMKANNFKSFTELIINFDKNLLNLNSFYRNLERIKNGEPLQYILEEASFLGYELVINTDCLIPRPETEGLVLETIKIINSKNLNHKDIVDVCTGSGCIAIAMQGNFKESNVYAIEKFQNTFLIAQNNFKKFNMSIISLLGDKVEPLLKRNLKVDVLISNPPYVENINDIEKKVLDYEPLHAIYIQDGTAFYENYFKHHREIMNKKFLMAFEINYDQKDKLIFLIKKYFDLDKINFYFKKDIYGLIRYLFIEGNYE